MNILVQSLGWLLVTITFIGIFRFARYLARPTRPVLYPGLIATTLTVVFVIIVDTIILLTGLLAITVPAVILLRKLGVHSYTVVPAFTRLRDRDLVPDWQLPRPGLPGADTDPAQPVTATVTTILDRVETILHRVEHLLDRSPPDEDDPVAIEFDDDWDDDL